jgi:rhamnogalacturonyl hydrolase YesR
MVSIHKTTKEERGLFYSLEEHTKDDDSELWFHNYGTNNKLKELQANYVET